MISNNIKNLRQSLDMTQEEFAKKLDVSPQAVSSWERGRTEPTMGMLYKIVDAFHCDLKDLVEMGEYTPDEVAVISSYRMASEEKRDVIRSILHIKEEDK